MSLFKKRDSSPDIKILIACHDDGAKMPDSKYIKGIQVGCSLSGKHAPGMLHDDKGVNISEKNASYCELTALYWAWKNLNADYIGLMHYRRYFDFSNTERKKNLFGDVLADINDPQTLQEIDIDDDHILDVVTSSEYILPEPSRFAGSPTMEEQFRDSWQLQSEDLNLLRTIISERSPEMIASFDSYMNSREGYFCNMMIMPKAMFNDYCQWLFDILEEHEKRRDYSNYDVDEYRVSGYLSERLLGVYATFLKNELKIKPTELQKVFFRKVERIASPIEPAFKKNKAVCAVMAASNGYVPYLSALLQSIKDTSDAKRDYDLIVLTSDITRENQQILKKQIDQKNISLRFYDVTPLAQDRLNDLKLRGHFQIETYYRLFMQEVCADYSKVLYLDSDMIVCQDIAQVYDTDVKGYLVAACKDADTAGLYNGYDQSRKVYTDEVLKLDDPYGYFQAGTIIFNLDQFREVYKVDDMFDLAASRDWKLLDQDVLNVLTRGCIKYLPMNWNVMTDWRGQRVSKIIRRAPKYLYDEYIDARKDPYIVHFAGTEKPWDDPQSDMAWYFWEAARKTPYYESLIKRIAGGRTKKKPISDEMWDKFYPLYTRLFPDRSKRREIAAALYRKLIVGRRD